MSEKNGRILKGHRMIIRTKQGTGGGRLPEAMLYGVQAERSMPKKM